MQSTPPPLFDIRKLYSSQQKREHCRQEMYDTILRQAHNRIETFAARKETTCVFQIPPIIIGSPLYDQYQCCGYVLQRLKHDGFVVSYLHPNMLHINWSRHLIENHVKQLDAHDAAEAKKAQSRLQYATSQNENAQSKSSTVQLGQLPTVTLPSTDYKATGKLFQ